MENSQTVHQSDSPQDTGGIDATKTKPATGKPLPRSAEDREQFQEWSATNRVVKSADRVTTALQLSLITITAADGDDEYAENQRASVFPLVREALSEWEGARIRAS